MDDTDPLFHDLLLYGSGELDPDRRREVEARIAADPAAAVFLDQLSTQARLLRACESASPMAFTEAALERQAEEGGGLEAFPSRHFRGGLAAAAAVVFAIGILVLQMSIDFPDSPNGEPRHFSSRRPERMDQLEWLAQSSQLLNRRSGSSTWAAYANPSLPDR
ncbi:MAG: hypothetical protein AAF591_22585 [Verrucomicrobiota bacterium]